jgi:excisionase family DNA binding protein
MDKKQYYSIAEVGKILGISRITVYKRVKKGDIHAVRIGRSYAIPSRSLDHILGRELKTVEKEDIDKAVQRVVEEYGDVLKKLGRE